MTEYIYEDLCTEAWQVKFALEQLAVKNISAKNLQLPVNDPE